MKQAHDRGPPILDRAPVIGKTARSCRPECSGTATGTGCRSKSAARLSDVSSHVAATPPSSRGARAPTLHSMSPMSIRPLSSSTWPENAAHAVLTTGWTRSPQRRASPRLAICSRPESRRPADATADDQMIRWWSRLAAGTSTTLAVRLVWVVDTRSRRIPACVSGRSTVVAAISICSGRSGGGDPDRSSSPSRGACRSRCEPVVGARAWPAANRSAATRHCRRPLGDLPSVADLRRARGS